MFRDSFPIHCILRAIRREKASVPSFKAEVQRIVLFRTIFIAPRALFTGAAFIIPLLRPASITKPTAAPTKLPVTKLRKTLFILFHLFPVLINLNESIQNYYFHRKES
jgi:hypothetical protein